MIMRFPLFGWILVLVAVITSLEVRAQYSPNCERNGRRDYCAITLVESSDDAGQTRALITFADHRVYAILRDDRSCRQLSEAVRACRATITSPPGGATPIPVVYRGTAYEGGYRHHYVGSGLSLTFYFLD
jgi:hypothetical protein